jgi:hypothetical protein
MTLKALKRGQNTCLLQQLGLGIGIFTITWWSQWSYLLISTWVLKGCLLHRLVTIYMVTILKSNISFSKSPSPLHVRQSIAFLSTWRVATQKNPLLNSLNYSLMCQLPKLWPRVKCHNITQLMSCVHGPRNRIKNITFTCWESNASNWIQSQGNWTHLIN